VQHALAHHDPVRPVEPRPPRDVPLAAVGRGLEHAGDEMVAQRPHPRQHRRQVCPEAVAAADAELVQLRARVQRVHRRDQRLRRHAADAGAGRAVGAVVDQGEPVRPLADLAQRRKPSCARADDHHVERPILACLHNADPPMLPARSITPDRARDMRQIKTTGVPTFARS
jgi:hypothetical protein